MSVVVRELHWWSEALLLQVAGRVQAALAAWAGDWKGARLSCAVKAFSACDAVDQPAAGYWLPLLDGHGEDGQLWLQTRRALEEELTAVLFGDQADITTTMPAVGPVAAEVADAAKTDLCKALQSLLSGHGAALPVAVQADPTPKRHWRAWSGAVRVSVDLGNLQAWLHIGPECVAALCDKVITPGTSPRAALPDLTPLREALAHRSLRLRAELSGVDLEIGTLQTLKPGDVVRLSHLLEDPLQIVTEHGDPVSAGYPGCVDRALAVELVRKT